jgi:ribonuclease HI
MTVTLYTDASFDHHSKSAACGFCLLIAGKLVKHQVLLVGNVEKPCDAEIFAITQAIQCAFLLPGVTKISAHTDYLPILTRKKRRWRYAELDETLNMCAENNILVAITYVKAHSGDKYNTLVDVSCRQNLKKLLHGTQKKGCKTSTPVRRSDKSTSVPTKRRSFLNW